MSPIGKQCCWEQVLGQCCKAAVLLLSAAAQGTVTAVCRWNGEEWCSSVTAGCWAPFLLLCACLPPPLLRAILALILPSFASHRQSSCYCQSSLPSCRIIVLQENFQGHICVPVKSMYILLLILLEQRKDFENNPQTLNLCFKLLFVEMQEKRQWSFYEWWFY